MIPRELRKRLTGQGWSVERTSKGHVKCVSPTGEVVITSGSPSDWRAERNFLSRLKKRGFKMNDETVQSSANKSSETEKVSSLPKFIPNETMFAAVGSAYTVAGILGIGRDDDEDE